MPDFYKWQGDNLLLRVYLQPRSSRDEIVGPHGDALKIRITAPPVEGKANQHLRKFLAKQFGVPISRVELQKGQTSRTKQWLIRQPAHLPELIPSPD